MEEIKNKQLITSIHTTYDKLLPNEKINQLHNLIQSYLLHLDQKRIQSIMPYFQKAKQQLQAKQKQLKQLTATQSSQNKLQEYYKRRNQLSQRLQELKNKIQEVKQKIKVTKLRRMQAQKQLANNQQIYKSLTEQYRKNHPKQNTKKSSIFPRISKFDYKMHHSQLTNNKSSFLHSIVQTQQKQCQHKQKQKQNFYNSINFHRIKEIQRLLQQIAGDAHFHKFQKMLVGDKNVSIVKKVFNNYSIKEYFDQFVKQKEVFKFMQRIQNL